MSPIPQQANPLSRGEQDKTQFTVIACTLLLTDVQVLAGWCLSNY